MMQVFLGLALAFSLHTPFLIGTHPNGELYTAIECVQCGDWYIPTDSDDLTCFCDWIDQEGLKC